MIKNAQRRFYFKTETKEGESIELYVGQSSGKQLGEDIANAQKEVLIVSPYIDEAKLDELITLKNRSVNVRLAFSDLNKKQYKEILKKLIHQDKETDIKKKEEKEKRTKKLFFGIIASLFITIVFFIYGIIKALNKEPYFSAFCFLLFFTCFYITSLLLDKKAATSRIEIYNYNYFEKLNFKYLRNNGENMFIHSKIYIIDRRVAYVGSLNYTTKGFTSNFETRVRITEKQKIAELVEFVHNIFDDHDAFKRHELYWLGKNIYTEEKY